MGLKKSATRLLPKSPGSSSDHPSPGATPDDFSSDVGIGIRGQDREHHLLVGFASKKVPHGHCSPYWPQRIVPIFNNYVPINSIWWIHKMDPKKHKFINVCL